MSVRALRFYARDIECTRSIVCALARTLQMSYFLWLNARRWEMCLCECATHTIARTPTMSISINDLVPNVRASNSQAVRPAMARSHRYVPCCSPCAYMCDGVVNTRILNTNVYHSYFNMWRGDVHKSKSTSKIEMCVKLIFMSVCVRRVWEHVEGNSVIMFD